jgi:hypothetical protein
MGLGLTAAVSCLSETQRVGPGIRGVVLMGCLHYGAELAGVPSLVGDKRPNDDRETYSALDLRDAP